MGGDDAAPDAGEDEQHGEGGDASPRELARIAAIKRGWIKVLGLLETRAEIAAYWQTDAAAETYGMWARLLTGLDGTGQFQHQPVALRRCLRSVTSCTLTVLEYIVATRCRG